MWTEQLTKLQAEEVRSLAHQVHQHDGVAPLNESATLALDTGQEAHLLHRHGDELVGYLQWQSRYGSAQLMVDPAHRRCGIGSRLARSLAALASTASAADWGVWSFGDLPAGQAFAEARGLVDVRGLLVLARGPLAESPTAPPPGLSIRGFSPADTSEFLAVNAAAFAEHAEQGSLNLADFTARTTEPWFDPAGLLLGFDEAGLAGFHWTKKVADVGEVYVLGIAPRAQGKGYGKALLQAGLAHLTRLGVNQVQLYVDRAEVVAVRMYESAGFSTINRDVFYIPGPEFSNEWGRA